MPENNFNSIRIEDCIVNIKSSNELTADEKVQLILGFETIHGYLIEGNARNASGELQILSATM